MDMARVRRHATERESDLGAEAEAARDEAVGVLESITDSFIALQGSGVSPTSIGKLNA